MSYVERGDTRTLSHVGKVNHMRIEGPSQLCFRGRQQLQLGGTVSALCPRWRNVATDLFDVCVDAIAAKARILSRETARMNLMPNARS